MGVRRQTVSCLAAFALLLALPQLGQAQAPVPSPNAPSRQARDLLMLRTGELKEGTLQGCTEQACTLAGVSTQRSAIFVIGLDVTGAAPPIQDATRDELHFRDNSVRHERLTAIDGDRVVTANGSYPRPRVAWIYLGSAVPRTQPPVSGRTGEPDRATERWEAIWITKVRVFQSGDPIAGVSRNWSWPEGHTQLDREGTIEAKVEFAVNRDGLIAGCGTINVDNTASTRLVKPSHVTCRSCTGGDEIISARTLRHSPRTTSVKVHGQRTEQDFRLWLIPQGLMTISLDNIQTTRNQLGLHTSDMSWSTPAAPWAYLAAHIQPNVFQDGIVIRSEDNARFAVNRTSPSVYDNWFTPATLWEHATDVTIRKLPRAPGAAPNPACS